MTQGEPLDTITYGIEGIPMIKRMKAAYTDITQPWYADGTSALGTFNNIGFYFNSLKLSGQGRGYLPNLQKLF